MRCKAYLGDKLVKSQYENYQQTTLLTIVLPLQSHKHFVGIYFLLNSTTQLKILIELLVKRVDCLKSYRRESNRS